jgi:hypothetical protein
MIRTKPPKKDLARRIFSHGFHCFGRVSFFIFCRVHIIQVGRRGAGKSFRLFGRQPALSIDVMVEDIRKVVEWLHQRLQIEKVYLVAHS